MRRKSLSILFWFALSIFFNETRGQDNSCSLIISGSVFEQNANLPLPLVSIWVSELSKGTISDEKGSFVLAGLCPGDYTLIIHSIGYKELKQKITLSASTNKRYYLAQTDIQLHEVEVVGHKEAHITTNASSSLKNEMLDVSRGGTLGDALKNIPGVTSFSTGSNIVKPVIHGLHSNRILIVNNGIRQEGQQWGVEHAPEIDPFVANEITVVKGAEAIKYGAEAMGGVVLVDPPALPVTKTLKGEINVIGATNGRQGTISGTLSGSPGKIKGLGWRIQATGKKGGNVRSPEYFQNNTGVEEVNFSGAVGYSNNDVGAEVFYSRFVSNIGILKDSHTGNLSDLEAIIANGRPFTNAGFTYRIENPRQQVIHDLLKLKVHYHLKNDSWINLQYGLQFDQRQEYDMRRGELNDKPALDLQLTTHSIDGKWDYKNSKVWSGTVGVGIINQINNNVPGTGITPLIPNYDYINLSAFTIQKLTTSQFELEGGLRFDYRNVNAARYNVNKELTERAYTYNNFSASLGGSYYFNDNISFKTNFGSAWRPPSVNELFSEGLHHGVAAIEMGNSNFKSEQSYKWANTLEILTGKFDLEITGYINRINNYIYLQPRNEKQITLRGTYFVYEYFQTDASFLGADISTNYQLSNAFQIYSKGSLIRVRDIKAQTSLPWIPTNRVEAGLSWKKASAGKLKDLSMTLGNLFVARQTKSSKEDIVPPPDGYSLLNMSIGATIPINRQFIKASISGSNLLNSSYRDYMNRFRYFTDEMGTNVIIRIKYTF